MERSVLFINACVRKESRTKRLADQLLLRLNRPVTEICLNEIAFPVVDEDFLSLRDRLIRVQDYCNPLFDLARQFSDAEEIVIAAPYWDLSFPAALKQYFEQINVTEGFSIQGYEEYYSKQETEMLEAIQRKLRDQ